jgi:hypothetical protein
MKELKVKFSIEGENWRFDHKCCSQRTIEMTNKDGECIVKNMEDALIVLNEFTRGLMTHLVENK